MTLDQREPWIELASSPTVFRLLVINGSKEHQVEADLLGQRGAEVTPPRRRSRYGRRICAAHENGAAESWATV